MRRTPAGRVGVARVGGLLFLVALILAARDEGRGVLRAEDRQIRIQLVKGIVALLLIIESHHIHGLRDIDRVHKSKIHRSSHRAGGVEALHGRDQAAGHFVADLGSLKRLLVEHRPHENTRVVAVPADHPFELANVFRRGVEISHLIHHEHAHAVADLE